MTVKVYTKGCSKEIIKAVIRRLEDTYNTRYNWDESLGEPEDAVVVTVYNGYITTSDRVNTSWLPDVPTVSYEEFLGSLGGL